MLESTLNIQKTTLCERDSAPAADQIRASQCGLLSIESKTASDVAEITPSITEYTKTSRIILYYENLKASIAERISFLSMLHHIAESRWSTAQLKQQRKEYADLTLKQNMMVVTQRALWKKLDGYFDNRIRL